MVRTLSKEWIPSVLWLMIRFVRREESLQNWRQMVIYPSGFIPSQSRTRREMEGSQKEPEATAVLPLIRGVSEAIQRILKPVGIRSADLYLTKDLSTHQGSSPNVRQAICSFRTPCEECTGAYIGQTGRSLGQGLKEHKRALKNFDVLSSGLSEHEWPPRSVERKRLWGWFASEEIEPHVLGVMAYWDGVLLSLAQYYRSLPQYVCVMSLCSISITSLRVLQHCKFVICPDDGNRMVTEHIYFWKNG